MAKKKFDDPIAQPPKQRDTRSQLEAYKFSSPNIRAMSLEEQEAFAKTGELDVLVISPLPPRIYKKVRREKRSKKNLGSLIRKILTKRNSGPNA